MMLQNNQLWSNLRDISSEYTLQENNQRGMQEAKK